MDKKTFSQFVLEEMRKTVPNLQNIEMIEPFQYKVELEDEYSFEMYLHNAWKAYQSTSNLNVVRDYLNAQVDLQKKMKTIHTQTLSEVKAQILPTIRSDGFLVNQEQGQIIQKNLLEGLNLVFCVDHPHFVYFITEKMAKKEPRFPLEEYALENIRHQGWVEPEHIETDKRGDFLVFEENKRILHYQFFIKEWVEKHIGDEFYFSMPTSKVVFVLNNKGAKAKHTAESLGKLRAITHQFFATKGYGLSPYLYSYRKGEYRKIG